MEGTYVANVAVSTGSSLFFSCVCVAMVCILAHMVSLGGLFHFSCSVVGLIFVFSLSSGDVNGLLGMFPQV